MRSKPSKAKKPAEQVVKDIRRATRRHFSAEDKIRLVLDGLRGEDSIAVMFQLRTTAQRLWVKRNVCVVKMVRGAAESGRWVSWQAPLWLELLPAKISMGEVVTFERDLGPVCSGAGIGETVAHVEIGPMTDDFTKLLSCVERLACHIGGDHGFLGLDIENKLIDHSPGAPHHVDIGRFADPRQATGDRQGCFDPDNWRHK